MSKSSDKKRKLAARRGSFGQWRKTRKATVSPTVNDLHWAAGFLEGEGSVSFAGLGKRKWSQHIDAHQVNPEPLVKLWQLFGGSLRPVNSKNPLSIRTICRWTVSGGRARGVMMTLYSLFSTLWQEKIRKMLRIPA